MEIHKYQWTGSTKTEVCSLYLTTPRAQETGITQSIITLGQDSLGVSLNNSHSIKYLKKSVLLPKFAHVFAS